LDKPLLLLAADHGVGFWVLGFHWELRFQLAP
jgi:hypothetical protein